MVILGIDSSGTTASAAVLCDGKVCSDISSDTTFTHSKTLLPMVDMAIKAANIEKKDIDLIAISKGPGSFTGLRIGAGVAKGLAIALKKDIVPVPTLEVLANRIPFANGIVCPIMNARRNQVYTAAYEPDFKNSGDSKYTNMKMVLPMEAMGIEELFEKLLPLGKPVVFTGDGVQEFEAAIREGYKGEYAFAPACMVKQSAAVVAVLGEKYNNEGMAVSPENFDLLYLRKSQAERDKEAKGAL